MARAEHLALTVVTLTTLLMAAGGARYGGGDYAVHMPAYGDDEPVSLDRDDYRAHSPDAPAALDYKYEEDFKGKTEQSLGAEANDVDSWRKPIRKQRKRVNDDFRLDDLDKYEPNDDFPKKSMNRFTKHRPRHKSHKFEADNEERPRFLKRPVRDRRDDMPELGGDEMQIDKENYLAVSSGSQTDKYRFVYRTTSVRPRRRPRDRFERPKAKEDDEESNADHDTELWPSLDKEKDFIDRRMEDDESLSHSRTIAPIRPFRPESGEDEEPALLRPLKIKNQAQPQYDNYNDYYDMKRAMNIKNKLPALRRTQVGQRLVPAPMPRSSTELLPNRRMLPEPTTRRTSHASTTTTVETEASRISTLPHSRTTKTPTVRTLSTLSLNRSKELSLAEKSRLSILKKAQKKESGRSDLLTKKPPVLLQVTNKLPTVLIVEPPSSVHPWMRASEVMRDSPERLRKVRRLMRQKLLANARNIHDLTENWDDVVCDYVDMSLLENTAYGCSPNDHHLALFFLFIYVRYHLSSIL